MISFPNAKINLGLNILAKREDGYHAIESCFYPIPWHDSLEILEAQKFSFHSYGLTIPGETSDNLCVKAYELIKVDFDIPAVEIHLLKSIPMGAGLGGGSADGAFTLNMLNELFQLKLSIEKLEHYALALGSDSPFFIQNESAIASGRGEKLETFSVDLNGKFLAIHNPEIHISTKEAYSKIKPVKPLNSISAILRQPISEWKNLLINDFETSVFTNHPEIEQLKKEMYRQGAAYSAMTGSGSTVFGIFENAPKNTGWKVLEL